MTRRLEIDPDIYRFSRLDVISFSQEDDSFPLTIRYPNPDLIDDSDQFAEIYFDGKTDAIVTSENAVVITCLTNPANSYLRVCELGDDSEFRYSAYGLPQEVLEGLKQIGIPEKLIY